MYKTKNQCPLDRKDIPPQWTATIDLDYQQKIKKKYLIEYNKQEAILMKQQRLVRDIVDMTLVVGNTHEINEPKNGK